MRCAACENKYRIKSAHFEREVHTGPRTLDETDTVLRSDSVDIDPDEVAPVSIDDEGNVVGLSGLSELMRWSDDQTNVQDSVDAKQAKGKRKAAQDADDPLPQAKPAKSKRKAKTKTKAKAKAKEKAEPSQDVPGNGRARAQALKRKKRNKMYFLFGGTGVVFIVCAILLVQILTGGKQTGPTTAEQDTTGTSAVADNPNPPETGSDPNTGTSDPKPPDELLIFSDDYKPSPNPEAAFVAPWIERNPDLPPMDVPTVLTPATHLTHEGWYVMDPPRGAADASGDSNVELGQLAATALSNGQTLLTGDVANYTDRVVANGELHIMLLDSTGNVFAETYTPLVMIRPKQKQPVALTIPTRYWKRSRGVRSGAQVASWADDLSPMQDVRLAPASQGPSTAIRVSVKHQGDKPLRRVKILLTATDTADKIIASFLVEENKLYIPENHWLDLVIATPLPQGKTAANWSAIVQPQ